MRAEINNR